MIVFLNSLHFRDNETNSKVLRFSKSLQFRNNLKNNRKPHGILVIFIFLRYSCNTPPPPAPLHLRSKSWKSAYTFLDSLGRGWSFNIARLVCDTNISKAQLSISRIWIFSLNLDSAHRNWLVRSSVKPTQPTQCIHIDHRMIWGFPQQTCLLIHICIKQCASQLSRVSFQDTCF